MNRNFFINFSATNITGTKQSKQGNLYSCINLLLTMMTRQETVARLRKYLGGKVDRIDNGQDMVDDETVKSKTIAR